MKCIPLFSLLLAQLVQSVCAASTEPNIIFLLADDQREDVLGCYGNPLIQTPTIDKLAAEGVRFENVFCEVPICAASRSTLFTGLSQRTHGYNFGEPKVSAEHMATSYPLVLKNAGYRVGFAGKYGMTYVAPGMKREFDFFKPIDRNPYLKEMPDGSLRHETDLCVDAGLNFYRPIQKAHLFAFRSVLMLRTQKTAITVQAIISNGPNRPMDCMRILKCLCRS